MRRLRWALWAGCALVVAVWGVRPALMGVHGDFGGFFAAAHAVWRGMPGASLYEWLPMTDALLDAGVDGMGLFSPNPPPLLLPFVALVALPARAAMAVWTVLQLALLAGALVWLARVARISRRDSFALAALVAVPLANELAFGQVYLVLLALVALAAILWTRGAQVLAGAALGVAIALKLTPALFLVPLALAGAWRACAAAATVAAALFGAAAWLGGAEMVRVFFTQVAPLAGWAAAPDPWAPAFQSYSSLLYRMFVGDPGLNPEPALDAPRFAAALGWLARGSLLGVGIAAAWRVREDRGAAPLVLGMFAALHLAIAPSSATYHAVWLLLAAAPLARMAGWAATEGVSRTPAVSDPRGTIVLGQGPPTPLIAGAGLLLILLAGLPPHPLFPLAHGWTTPLAYPRLWAATALAALMAALLLRETARPARRRRLALGIAGGLLATSLPLWLPTPPDDGARLVSRLARFPVVAQPVLADDGMYVAIIGAAGGWEIRGPRGVVAQNALFPAPLGDGRVVYEKHQAGRRWLEVDGRPLPGGDGCRDPSMAPDAIVYAACPDGIRAIRLAGGHVLRVPGAGLRAPVTAGAQLYFVGAGGTLTTDDGGVLAEHVEPHLALSPDGSLLAFSLDGDVWLAPTLGGEVLRVTTHPGLDGDPSFTPDGEQLVFAGARGPGATMRRAYQVNLQAVARRRDSVDGPTTGVLPTDSPLSEPRCAASQSCSPSSLPSKPPRPTGRRPSTRRA